MTEGPKQPRPSSAKATTSIEKALEVCETLSRHPRGMSLGELVRDVQQPAPTVHRLLGVLRRREYVRQDEETQRYSLTLKMLDLSFQFLGRSELRLHAYPVLREWVVRSGMRTFLAVPSHDEVTYIWPAGPDEVAMRTVYGREMPAHCAIYFSPVQATRRLSCLRLASDSANADIHRLGALHDLDAAHRLCCTCAPVHDYTGREVARVGVFAHRAEDGPLGTEYKRACRELARLVSVRLGHLPAAALSEAG
jgi:DNA-binding IclR family transcriptional regulator